MPPEQVFAEWDPEPIAAASIWQVHRAITRDGRAVAVKVQYPGIAETIAADLGNVSRCAGCSASSRPARTWIPSSWSWRERSSRSSTTAAEADNQQLFADYYDGHPTIGVPKIVRELSTRRVVTSDLATGARFSELAGWSQEERPGRRDDLPVRLPQPVRHARVQRRPAPGRSRPVPRRREGDIPRLRAGEALHRGRAAPADGHGPRPVRRKRPGGLPAEPGRGGFRSARRAAEHRCDRGAPGRVLRHDPPAPGELNDHLGDYFSPWCAGSSTSAARSLRTRRCPGPT